MGEPVRSGVQTSISKDTACAITVGPQQLCTPILPTESHPVLA